MAITNGTTPTGPYTPDPEDEDALSSELNDLLRAAYVSPSEIASDSYPPPGGERRFVPLGLKEALMRPPKQWLIDQMFGPGNLVTIFGQPGSGKTFCVIDLVFSACLGTTFAERFNVARPLTVAYCAGEGIDGITARLAAAAKAYFVDDLPGFYLFELVPQLYDNDSPDSIAKSVTDWKESQSAGTAPPLDLLVIDTQHTATVGAEENSAKDMGKVLDSAKRATKELGCAVILVHHSNKAGTGERGSSVMRGAMDCMIECKKVEGLSGKFIMSCEKMKDAPAWDDQMFSLAQMDASAYVRWDEPNSTKREGKQMEDAQAIITCLRESPGTRYPVSELAKKIGLGPESKQIYNLIKKARKLDPAIKSGPKQPGKDVGRGNPEMYWYSDDTE